MEWIANNMELVLIIAIPAVELLLRKIPGAKSILLILDGVIDKIPGLKNNP